MKRILAFLDFSAVTPAVVRIARDIARAFGSELALVHVVESEAEFIDTASQDDISPEAVAGRAHQRQLEILNLALKKEGINSTTQIVKAKSPHENVVGKILQEMTMSSPDLIVIGAHSHGRLYQLLVRSVTDAVVRRATCPVLIVPSDKGSSPIWP